MLSEDELRDAVLLVFANKQDLPKAMPAPEITEKVSGLARAFYPVFALRLFTPSVLACPEGGAFPC